MLKLAESPRVRTFVHRYGPRLGTDRFVAGDRLEDAIALARQLHHQGLSVSLAYLGEHVQDPQDAEAATNAYVSMLKQLRAAGLEAHVSLKLTQLGLGLDEEFAYRNVRRIVAEAERQRTFIRMDMEQSRFVSPTLRIYRRLRQEGLSCVGVVLQAYLRRTIEDLRELLPLRPNVRLCKGAYHEPKDIAFTNRRDIDAAFRRILALSMTSENFTAVATHDARIIHFVREFVAEHAIPRERYEFQMLYGIRTPLSRSLVAEGYRVRIYLPFGEEWYRYLMRRLAERPANLLFVLRNLSEP